MKFATKLIWQYPPYLNHVATLPWDVKISNFCRCERKRKQVAF